MVIERRKMTQEENVVVYILTWQILMLTTHNSGLDNRTLTQTHEKHFSSHDKLPKLSNSHHNRLTGHHQLVIETEKSLRKVERTGKVD